MNIGRRYCFTPKWLPSLATLLLLPILLSLGSWQLHRAHYKEHLQALYQSRLQQAPLNLDAISKISNPLYYPVQVQGQFDNQHTLLLDNQILNHQPGYHVLTPLHLTTGQTILVNRGWIPIINRRELPAFTPVNGIVQLTGVIAIPSSNSFHLGSAPADSSLQWPLRIEYLDLATLSQWLAYPLAPYIVLLNPNQPYGFQRDWSPASLRPEMHYGYAVQWFALAGALLIIFITVNIHRR